MFTGIIQGVGDIVSVSESNTVTSVSINLPSVEGLQIGARVSINGVCLTVVSINQEKVKFDIITETLNRTNLGDLSVGSLVNIERSLKFGFCSIPEQLLELSSRVLLFQCYNEDILAPVEYTMGC